MFSPDIKQCYKSIGEVTLALHLFFPAAESGRQLRPTIVFFFGGGWVSGTPEQFYPQCRHFASLGLLAVSAEYRVRNTHGTTPFEAVADAKSAVRWLRGHAAEFDIDPNRIVAGGGSAGGHLAACTGVIAGLDEVDEDPAVSSVPNALILFNPVYDTTVTGYRAVHCPGREQEISPVHHIRSGLPPALLFHGTADTTVPYENAQRFQAAMLAAGNVCELITFEGKAHAFFNYGRDGNVAYERTMQEADRFLAERGILCTEKAIGRTEQA